MTGEETEDLTDLEIKKSTRAMITIESAVVLPKMAQKTQLATFSVVFPTS